MGLSLRNNMSVFLDTAPLIYFWEQHEHYFPALAAFFDEVYAKNILCCVSLITYVEIVTLPLKHGNRLLASKYRNYLTNAANFQLAGFDLTIADTMARFRAEHHLRTPDAIQLATADACGVDYILTNDKAWKNIEMPGRGQIVLVEELISG